MIYVNLGICETKAYLGLAAEVEAELPLATDAARRADAFGGREAEDRGARCQLVLGKTDAAFAFLRRLLADVSPFSPNRLRADPLWARVKDDPRFEEILRSARRL